MDDISLIGELQRMVDSEGVALTAFLRELGIYIKEIKDRAAAQVQLALGFWWDSVNRTRTLSERKQQEYVAMLREFETRRTLTLRERQQVAGRMQRAVMTMPPGAACFMAISTMYSLMRGLSLPWQSRRTTRAERLDFRCLRELLQRNLGRGFFSLDQFGEAPVVDTDASKSRAYPGGGYASRCGRYRFFRYGAAAQRHMIDFLEGDVVVEAVRDLGHLWHRMVVTFRIDNSAFQRSAVKGWSRAERLTLLLRRLFELCVQFECVLCFVWLSTKENVYADALSRVDGEATFLRLVKETDFLPPNVFLRRDPRCGAVRQLGDSYTSNSLKDGPQRAQQNLALSVPYRRASIYVGLPNESVADHGLVRRRTVRFRRRSRTGIRFVRATAGPALSSRMTASEVASWQRLFYTWRRTPTWWARQFRTTCGLSVRGSSFSASWIQFMAWWIGKTSCRASRCAHGCRPSPVRRSSSGGFAAPCAAWTGDLSSRFRQQWSCWCCCLRLLALSLRWPWRFQARMRSMETSRCRSRMLRSCRVRSWCG